MTKNEWTTFPRRLLVQVTSRYWYPALRRLELPFEQIVLPSYSELPEYARQFPGNLALVEIPRSLDPGWLQSLANDVNTPNYATLIGLTRDPIASEWKHRLAFTGISRTFHFEKIRELKSTILKYYAINKMPQCSIEAAVEANLPWS